jgi:thiamine pyrophosphate-dependent acetolactate synthase large subunit-like protein
MALNIGYLVYDWEQHATNGQLAFSNKYVVCIRKDGSFQKLITIIQYKLPIRIIMLNDKNQGLI